MFAIIAAALFLAIGPPKLLATTDQPDFCRQCHVMESNYEAWLHTGAHRRSKCVDCHLPNHNTGLHYAWKSIDGLKDALFFYSGRVPERITLSSHGRTVLQANCVRCHETTVMMTDTDRKCWSCHRRVSHQHSGAGWAILPERMAGGGPTGKRISGQTVMTSPSFRNSE